MQLSPEVRKLFNCYSFLFRLALQRNWFHCSTAFSSREPKRWQRPPVVSSFPRKHNPKFWKAPSSLLDQEREIKYEWHKKVQEHRYLTQFLIILGRRKHPNGRESRRSSFVAWIRRNQSRTRRSEGISLVPRNWHPRQSWVNLQRTHHAHIKLRENLVVTSETNRDCCRRKQKNFTSTPAYQMPRRWIPLPRHESILLLLFCVEEFNDEFHLRTLWILLLRHRSIEKPLKLL